jgi:photosystem II stability/assembly factor-like uncharacterized protein
MRGIKVTLLVLASAAALVLPAAADEVKIDADTFGGLEARSIGPAAMSGRISAIDAIEGDRLTVYVGSASGGLWKSVDGGLAFKPVFDKHNQSIGAVTVDRRNPRTVWVGTGESCTRNSVSVGDGVYKTTDGGENWQKLGLADSERIARIVVSPGDSDTVLVCATGKAFAPHPERGVFRTTDGGKTWEKTLFVNDDTGCSDLAIDPQDGNIVYAGMWQYRRKPWFFTSGGPGSGLFKSTDGGKTWRRITKGLPEGELGRIALAVAPTRTSVVYATVEAKQTALYRSDDLGESWARLNTSSAVTGRPFYFSHLAADPKDWKRIYRPGFSLSVSDDGGRTFSGVGGGGMMGPAYHGDTHALWIDPRNPEHLILGTDGGVYVSHDRGTHWRFVGTLPVSQFYHVSYDMEFPYYVYGGLQDNSTWYGPSRRPGSLGGSIQNKHWYALTGGDGFWAFVDPSDPDVVYNEYQGGNLFRIRKSTLESKDIKPSPRAGEPKYRFNWNTPIHMSPNDKGTVYYGAQFLFRSRDRGDSWERLSPDLTTNDPAKQKQDESGGLSLDNSTAENHCTIFAIAESPKSRDVIWVGTDDGNVQLTRDGGKSWANVVGAVPGLPKNAWVSSVEASRFAEGTAYVTFDNHMLGDMQTYVYRTTDHGKTWQSLVSGDLRGYAHVVKEDLVNPDLLFVGTESGLFVSVDGGKQWGQFTGNLPGVAVRDLAIHPRDHDLLIATHGRGIYIVDDITPLRKLTREVVEQDVAFLESRPTPMYIPAVEFAFGDDSQFDAPNPPEAAMITYYLKKRHLVGDLRLEVYDKDGKLLSTIPGGKRRGINRVPWPMREPAPPMPASSTFAGSIFSLFGPRMPEGTYTVKMIKGKDTYTSTVSLVPDPRSKVSAEDRALQRETTRKLYGMLERLTFVADSIVDARDQARARAEKLPKGDALQKRLSAFADAMEGQRTALVATKEAEGGISGEEKLREELGMLYGNVNGYEGRPTASQTSRMAVLGQDMEAAYTKFVASADKEMAALNPQLKGKKLDPLAKLSQEDWSKRRKK